MCYWYVLIHVLLVCVIGMCINACYWYVLIHVLLVCINACYWYVLVHVLLVCVNVLLCFQGYRWPGEIQDHHYCILPGSHGNCLYT